ncbi:uncharacterized protein LOC116933298 isoform X1 [Daphnia magna]|uniref:uncharacterized protein LOC116933298 isoform X1 n=1 Tax=Daphnia magna TaxID=35525 RepID=UPI001E1BB0C9|nr:uncharacterized protein LOC116933298 isoform X1 [Daphnia magna]
MWRYYPFRCCVPVQLAISIASVFYVLYHIYAFKLNFDPVKHSLIMEESHSQQFKLNHSTNLEPQPQSLSKYNLMEESYGTKWIKTSETNYELQLCTIEYANTQKLEQDHPCVIRLIRDHYLHHPAPRDLPYHLNKPEILDPSDGQSKGILHFLRNQTNGFFIECGGYDGEYLSNTLFMERVLNWTGLLVEADRKAFDQLATRNRKAFIAPICLSTKPYPMQVLYDATNTLLSSIIENKQRLSRNGEKNPNQGSSNNETENVYKIQCFPLYSILVAIGRTEIDYFSLDVEGSEFKILKTIPWHKVDIKTLTVEWDHTPEGEAAISHLMQKNKFVKFGNIEMAYSREVLYIKDFLESLRLYE